MQLAIAIVCGLVLIGFIVFAFRQGLKVTLDRSGNGPNGSNIQ
ncbi:MAG: hypothetical protein QHD01_11415 [Bradyrhizobium sp.]|nr:hypothetical protein [Bradyrhizobium sp.]MDX3967194.1 hypothetical protein [Bradyrhizobium sp.]